MVKGKELYKKVSKLTWRLNDWRRGLFGVNDPCQNKGPIGPLVQYACIIGQLKLKRHQTWKKENLSPNNPKVYWLWQRFWLIDCMVFNSISVILPRPVHLSMLSWSSLTSTPQNILSKPLAAFPHNHCQNNGQQWERNESCRNDYYQFS